MLVHNPQNISEFEQNVFVCDGWIMESGHSKNFLAGESVTAGLESLHQTLPATHVTQAGAGVARASNTIAHGSEWLTHLSATELNNVGKCAAH